MKKCENGKAHPIAKITELCLYCGSGPGTDPRFMEEATAFGKIIAEARIGLTYGGGSIGLMGAAARSAIKEGGTVKGFIPESLMQREKPDIQGVKLTVTRDFHERKLCFYNNADAFIVFPGGCGTLEEAAEQLTWTQVGDHSKPVLFVNLNNYWEPLFQLFEHMEKQQFIRAGLTIDPFIVDHVDEILPMLLGYIPARSLKCREGEQPRIPLHQLPQLMLKHETTAH